MVNLIIIGLIVIPFLTLPGQDTRYPKEIAALALAMSIGCWAVHSGWIRGVKNFWILAFLGFLIASNVMSPNFDLSLGPNQISGIWDFKPCFYIMVYFLMFIGISSFNFNEINYSKIFNVISWCGFAMACYVLTQYLGFDQFFYVKSKSIIQGTQHANLVGTLGQPTLVAPFLALSVPFAYYFRRYWCMAIMALAVVLTGSKFSMGAMFLSSLFMLSINHNIYVKVLSFIILLASAFIILSHPINTDGRNDVWKNIITDIRMPPSPSAKETFALTGFGIGSFSFTYPAMHGDNEPSHAPWLQAHNEYLELLRGCGIIGLGIFLASIGWMLNKIRPLMLDKRALVLTSSFICIALNCGGTFLWHLGAYIFYTVVIVALIHNIINEREYLYGAR